MAHEGVRDLAMELPTGTGKTAVGLAIAEWKRRQGKRVAFLSLTNQLAGQVLLEARRLGVECADLRGRKEQRSAQAEGRFLNREAVGVSNYSNLFNIKPVISGCDLLVFDDAHGGEQYVSGMWTVNVKAGEAPDTYDALLMALKPALSESQFLALQDRSNTTVEIADFWSNDSCISSLTATLDGVKEGAIKFPWIFLRNHIKACLVLLSQYEITIRPLVAPTHTHEAFSSAGQRIYMSATLGSESDLKRSYGIRKLDVVRAQGAQWGRRYVFIPGLYAETQKSIDLLAKLWAGMEIHRAVLLAPSEALMDRAYDLVEKSIQGPPTRLGAPDIADSLDAFTTSDDVFLTLAGRYDGLDLPDEQCRLLVLVGSPAATNPLERHLSERWKMGPVLRGRERTRLIQGMGRATRNANDFAIIYWLGQALVNSSTDKALIAGMPRELAAEIKWGAEQSVLAAEDPDSFVAMMLGILQSPSYRNSANEQINGILTQQVKTTPPDYDDAGEQEVKYSHAVWDEDYGYAQQAARGIADKLVSAELAGYRAWWLLMAAVAGELGGNADAAVDSLSRAAMCGVNSGWLKRALQRRKIKVKDEGQAHASNAEGVWDAINDWGWAGPRFSRQISRLRDLIANPYHKSFHEGCDLLGRTLGARVTRTTKPGDPDVVWSFDGDVHFTLEAKTEKTSDEISKADILEAKGHADWVRAKLAEDPRQADIRNLIVAPSPKLHEVAEPFGSGLWYISPDQLRNLAVSATELITELRAQLVGRDFAAVEADLSASLRHRGLDLESIKGKLLVHELRPT
jgi:hypothetical protein